ncbi:MAG: hypothetical protein AAFX93_19520 [Verrucomicrobiota bacterium]
MSHYQKQSPEPSVIYAKTSIFWKRTIDAVYIDGVLVASALAGEGYTAVYEMRNESGLIVINTGGSGRVYAVSESSVTTEAYAGGEYTWQLFLVNGDDRWLIDEGTMKIVGYSATGQDNRSQVKRILDAINATIEGRASRADMEYSIQTGSGSRSIKHASMEELIKARSHFSALYHAEQARSGKRRSIIKSRFCNR